MKRFRTTLSAIAAGFIAAAAIHFAAREGVRPAVHRWSPHLAEAVSRLVAFAEPEPLVHPPAAAPTPLPRQEPPISVVLLAQPIVILRGNQFSGLQLPPGTRVEVLADEGESLRVRYAQSIITIPRSAIMKGVYARNVRLAHS